MRPKNGDFCCCLEAPDISTALHEALTALGVNCAIIAPDPIPRRNGDRIQKDRYNARKLAEKFAAGFLTECFVLDLELRSVRSREELMKNLHRYKMEAIDFLHARGHSYNARDYWAHNSHTLSSEHV